MFTEEQLKQLREVMREEIKAGGKETKELVQAGTEQTRRDLQEEIRNAKGDLLVEMDEHAESIAEMFHETWKKMEAGEERIKALEEHTGLIKHN